jgi:hypothetical protein
MKILIVMLLLSCGLLFAAGICQTPGCGHPKWTHGRSGACMYDSCTHYTSR